jgi:dipicolinate synthase subunit A
MEAIPTAKIGEKVSFDLIFNTVPAILFNRMVLQQFPKTMILIDLASSPGGVDLEAAKELKINVVQALSLPAKIAPKAAGKVIQQTIYMMMRE